MSEGPSKASIEEVGSYLQRYVEVYQREYDRFTAPPHERGGGYPEFPISPYLYSPALRCLLGINGALIIDQSKRPPYEWHIAGGPAIKVDYEPTRTPKEVVDLLKKEGLTGKPIGIYRIVSKSKLPEEVWRGIFGSPVGKTEVELGKGRTLHIEEFDLDVVELLVRATFGACGAILDMHLPNSTSPFWFPTIIRGMGFFPADLNNRAFYNYLEFLPHRDASAWDPRSVRIRAKADVRRDFVATVATQGGATLSFGETNDWAEHLRPSDAAAGATNFAGVPNDPLPPFLDRVASAIADFEKLVKVGEDLPEAAFQEFLQANSILLDVYGRTESKPRFVYPRDEKSPVGKAYVEPDFLITFPYNRTYRLVELERENKDFATAKGHSLQDFNQAAFQIGEWRNYIQTQYHVIKDRYPGINANCGSMIIMSRTGRGRFTSESDFRNYIDLLKATVQVDEVLTYDDLLERAKFAYSQLRALGSR